MKLKKIASLALAGVMAVSMLAGCKGGSTVVGGKDDANVPSIVTAVNNGQSSWNEVKINFTSDSALEAAIDKAVDMYQQDGGNSALYRAAIAQYAGLIGAENTTTAFYSSNGSNKPTSNDDGETVTFLQVYSLGMTPASNEYLMNNAAHSVDVIVGNLESTTLVTEDEDATNATKDGAKYYDFDYTGNVATFSVERSAGYTSYYMVLVIEQTVTEKTLEK